MTGTAVNPTLRAAFLAELTNNEVQSVFINSIYLLGDFPLVTLSNSLLCGVQVTLVIPWLAPSDQKLVFPNDLCFQKPSEQEQCIREWVRKRTGENQSTKQLSGRVQVLLSCHGRLKTGKKHA